MHVVFDTNAFFTDLRMNGSAFEQLFGARVGLTLCMPAVVLEEAVAHFGRQLEKLTTDVRKLDRMLGRESVTPERTIHDELAAYRDHLANRFHGEGRRVLPFPTTPHDALVRRATERRRPFQEAGTGYRDALIWDSIVELAQGVREPIRLVTNNTRDFAESGGKLHADLERDLAAHGLELDTVQLLPRVDELLRDFVRPKLKTLGTIVTELAEERFGAFSVRNWIEDELTGYVVGQELELLRYRRRYDAVEISVIEAGNVDEFEVEDVYELPSHAIGLEFNASVHTHVREDFAGDPDFSWERDFDGSMVRRPLWRERRTRSEAFDQRVRYRVRLTLDPTTWTTSSADVEIRDP
jgi:hypothetical protein